MRAFVLTHKRLVAAMLAASTLMGVLAAIINVGSPQARQISAASTQVLIDTPAPGLVERRVLPQFYDSLVKRAELMGRVMASPPVLERAAKRLGVPADQIGAVSRDTGNIPHALSEPDSEERASEILLSKFPYRLEMQARPGSPIVGVYAQAPTPAAARGLADAVAAALGDQLNALADEQQFPRDRVPTIHQLGPARGGVVNSKAPYAMIVLTFGVAFGITFAVLAAAVALRRRRLLARAGRAEAPTWAPAADDWPRTTRLMPWTLAIFLAVLWLVPFYEIQLAISLPIDMKFDRLVLPLVGLAWLFALLAGGTLAPRFRFTWIHGAVGVFVAVAFISVVLDARYLNQSLELDQSLKRLPLLITYVSLFLFASTAVRRSEVHAFMKYTLVLAVVCALGIVWEYRMKVNLFFVLSDAVLPGPFKVAAVDASGVDEIGRRVVRGPAGVPLEAVAMLAMALPVALVSAMHAQAWRTRLLYGIAACVLLAAAIATYRKSALLAPLSVVATLAYFRRRELLKLAPLGFVLLVVIHVLSPGALGSTAMQLDANRLGVATVSDRAVDYDAVRPDVWSHLIFGRGWGTYNHIDYRILDSEILQRVIEMGVIGLLSYVGMGVAVVLSTRRIIAARDPEAAPLALMGAAAAVAFLVASALFDVLSFPHATYIFLYMAGLSAVVVASGERRPAEEPPMRRDGHGGRMRSPAPTRGRRPGRVH
jgi:O-antigen ligase